MKKTGAKGSTPPSGRPGSRDAKRPRGAGRSSDNPSGSKSGARKLPFAPPQTPARTNERQFILRLNKALAHAGVCSRRAADELIKDGKVAVNGEIVQGPGVTIDVRIDKVVVDGRPVSFEEIQETSTYMVNKPVQVVSTASDPQGRKTVLDLLPEDISRDRLYPVGRLDFFSEGLLLLSNDGELTHRLTHPRWHVPKVYRVLIRGTVMEKDLETMRSGMTLAEGEKLAPVKVEVVPLASRETRDRTMLEMTLEQGVNRQIRRMCRDLGLTILFLRRTAQGPISLGKLPRGRWRALTSGELEALRKAVGL